MIRKFFQLLCVPVVHVLKPIRIWAWTTRFSFIRGIILELMTWIDTLMVLINIQNGALLLNHKVFKGGNFFFGKSLMVTNHAEAAEAIVKSQLRGSLFMGLPIVAFAPPALMTNASPTAVSQPARGILRDHMNKVVFTEARSKPSLESMRSSCADALKEWTEHPKRDHFKCIRGTVTQVLSVVLADIQMPKEEADAITAVYLRRFAEFSAFAHFAPFILSFLGTEESVRKDVFMPLRRKGMDTLVVDMVLFAGMFSIGTIFIKCVENTKEHNVDYASLSAYERMAFVIESIRLWPTVSTVHRIVEEPETVTVAGKEITVPAGREIAYPFVCTNRDASAFEDPESFRLDRSPEEVMRIQSWSAGKHVCPARDISILVTVLLLDTLADAAGDLREVKITNIEV